MSYSALTPVTNSAVKAERYTSSMSMASRRFASAATSWGLRNGAQFSTISAAFASETKNFVG